jgi:hypothetical protein
VTRFSPDHGSSSATREAEAEWDRELTLGVFADDRLDALPPRGDGSACGELTPIGGMRQTRQ